MIQKVGLLPPFNHAQIPFAWDMYVRDDADGLANSIGFKKTFSTDVTIDFIGSASSINVVECATLSYIAAARRMRAPYDIVIDRDEDMCYSITVRLQRWHCESG